MPKGFYKRSDAHKKSISLKLIGRKLSEETRKRMSKSRMGRKHSEETRNKQSIASKGKKKSEEHIRNISLSHKGQCPWNKVNDLKGEELLTYKRKLSAEYQAKNYDKNKEKFNRLRRESRAKNPEIVRAMNNNRRAATKDLTVDTIQRVYEDNIKKYGTLTCYLCEKSVSFKKDHLEHKNPLSRGGTNLYENLAVSCQKCNNRKHNKTEEEYRERIGETCQACQKN